MKKMILFHNIQIVLNRQFFLITKAARKKKKDTLNTNGKDEDEDNFRIYHSKQHELEGGTARSFKHRKVKNKQINFLKIINIIAFFLPRRKKNRLFKDIQKLKEFICSILVQQET